MNPKDRKALEVAREALSESWSEDAAGDERRHKALALIDERLQVKSRAEELAERGFVKPPYPTAADDFGERLQAGEKVAYPEGDVVGPCICGSWPGGKCCKCPKADEVAPDVLPNYLLNAIGDYSHECLRRDVRSDLERIHLWEVLIKKIKQYASEQMSRTQADEREEPVAWMRAEGPDGISTQAYCITDKVKQIWLNANPKQVERYTIPLYAHGRKGNG